MVHGKVPQPSPADAPARSNFLPFQTWNCLEPALVEQFRGKRANVRVQSPGVRQIQPLLGADGYLAGENVVQGGNTGSFRMANLRGLVQLPGIAQKYQILGGV